MEHLEHFEDYRRTRARTYTSIEEEVFQVFQVRGAATRWHVVCRLLAHPSRESRRLAALLTGWPAEVRRHLLVDDCARRLWLRRNAQTAREQEAVSG